LGQARTSRGFYPVKDPNLNRGSGFATSKGRGKGRGFNRDNQQYRELPGCLSRGSCISLGSRRSCSRLRRRRLIITTHHKPTYHITTSHHNSSQLITPYHIPSHHSSTSHTSLITAPLLITTHHNSTSERSTSHHNSSQLITSQIITAQLLTPLLTPHLSHLPELYINLRYIKAWHVGLSGPFI